MARSRRVHAALAGTGAGATGRQQRQMSPAPCHNSLATLMVHAASLPGSPGLISEPLQQRQEAGRGRQRQHALSKGWRGVGSWAALPCLPSAAPPPQCSPAATAAPPHPALLRT